MKNLIATFKKGTIIKFKEKGKIYTAVYSHSYEHEESGDLRFVFHIKSPKVKAPVWVLTTAGLFE